MGWPSAVIHTNTGDFWRGSTVKVAISILERIPHIVGGGYPRARVIDSSDEEEGGDAVESIKMTAQKMADRRR